MSRLHLIDGSVEGCLATGLDPAQRCCELGLVATLIFGIKIPPDICCKREEPNFVALIHEIWIAHDTLDATHRCREPCCGFCAFRAWIYKRYHPTFVSTLISAAREELALALLLDAHHKVDRPGLWTSVVDMDFILSMRSILPVHVLDRCF